MAQAVRKAVIPVAGLGTRFLPTTKAVSKELLPILDRPLIDHAVAEARAAGLEACILVVGRNEAALRSFFALDSDLEAELSRKDPGLVAALKDSEPPPESLIWVRQDAPLGLGHAVACAREAVGEEPFAVILPDDLMDADPPCIGQLIDAFAETGGNVIAVEEVPRAMASRYGILEIGGDDGQLAEVRGLVEKPRPEEAPSTLAIVGRYVLRPEVFDLLSQDPAGAGGEIQLTDAIAGMIGRVPVHGLRFRGRRFDCGSRAGFVEAQLHFALGRPEMRDRISRFVRAETGEWE